MTPNANLLSPDSQTFSEISHLNKAHDNIKAAVTERNCGMVMVVGEQVNGSIDGWVGGWWTNGVSCKTKELMRE